ncbi:hypothetical protein HBH70_182930 [Parastagonospora nodorum]|nr:hypothetical protein HBH70_182930 [Parastagonospora nodorum]
MISSNSMSQINIREGYRITTLEVIELIEDLISYLAVAKCTQLRNAQIPKVFYEAAYSAKVKIEDLSNTLTLTLSKTAQRQSSSIISNRSTALITNKFSVTSLTKPAILNNANIALVDAVHYSVIDALMITLIKDDDDLLGTINSHIKPPLKRCKTKAADSRHAKASRGRTKKDKDLENSNTSSNVLRSRRRDRAAASQLKKTRDKEELAKLDSLLDSDNYCLDSSLDINPKDDLEDEEATIAKNLAREQKERLKALLNAKTRDSLSARVETAIEHCTLEDYQHVRGLVATLPYTSLQTHTSSTLKSCYLTIKCKIHEQKATRQNTTQLTMMISYILLKARERSTARVKGASPLTPNLNKQL